MMKVIITFSEIKGVPGPEPKRSFQIARSLRVLSLIDIDWILIR
jgi:hypothetical protein